MLNLAELHNTEAELAKQRLDKRRSVEKRRRESVVRSPEAAVPVPSASSPASGILSLLQRHSTVEQVSAYEEGLSKQNEELAVAPAEPEPRVEHRDPKGPVQSSEGEAEISEEDVQARRLYSEGVDVLERGLRSRGSGAKAARLRNPSSLHSA